MFHLHRFFSPIAAVAAFLLLISFQSCGTKNENSQVADAINIDYFDAGIQQIISLRGKYNSNGLANTDALKTYLKSDKAAQRLMSAMVLAAIQDSNMIEPLQIALKDEYSQVRKAAAFALGTTKNSRAATVLSASFKTERSHQVKAAILEAIGRCGTAEDLKYLATAAPYSLKDSSLLQAQAAAIFLMASRGIIHSEGTNKIINEFIANTQMYPAAKLTAALYLARTTSVELESFEPALTKAVATERDTNVLMYLTIALAKTKTTTALNSLKNLYYETKSAQVKINVLRGLGYFAYDSVKNVLFDAVKDSLNHNISYIAAEQLYATGKDLDALLYNNLAALSKNWRTKYMLHSAAIHNLAIYKTPQRNFISQKLIAEYPTLTSEYEKAALIKAAGENLWSYKFIVKLLTAPTDSVPVSFIVKTACAEALVNIRTNPDFDKIVGLNKIVVLNELNLAFRVCIEQSDAGVQAIISEMFCSNKIDFSLVYPDYQFLNEAVAKLKLPRDVETYLFLQKSINVLSKNNNKKVVYHSLLKLVEPDWQIIKTIAANNTALISTNKGDIIIELFYKDAPATVSHFVQLAQSRFYDNKTFHRVVPNFVIQGGCPRGDGYGGFDYGTPTELSYQSFNKSGILGMASAGKDTESSQFFITQAPALHLDGSYTAFAQVIKGLEVVQNIAVGDTIKLVKLLN